MASPILLNKPFFGFLLGVGCCVVFGEVFKVFPEEGGLYILVYSRVPVLVDFVPSALSVVPRNRDRVVLTVPSTHHL
jgi:hypothetical protein